MHHSNEHCRHENSPSQEHICSCGDAKFCPSRDPCPNDCSCLARPRMNSCSWSCKALPHCSHTAHLIMARPSSSRLEGNQSSLVFPSSVSPETLRQSMPNSPPSMPCNTSGHREFLEQACSLGYVLAIPHFAQSKSLSAHQCQAFFMQKPVRPFPKWSLPRTTSTSLVPPPAAVHPNWASHPDLAGKAVLLSDHRKHTLS